MSDGSTGAGVTTDNVKQLLLNTGAREVHVGSACQENVPRTVPREDAAVRLGFVGEGTCVHVFGRVAQSRVLRVAALFFIQHEVRSCA